MEYRVEYKNQYESYKYHYKTLPTWDDAIEAIAAEQRDDLLHGELDKYSWYINGHPITTY